MAGTGASAYSSKTNLKTISSHPTIRDLRGAFSSLNISYFIMRFVLEVLAVVGLDQFEFR